MEFLGGDHPVHDPGLHGLLRRQALPQQQHLVGLLSRHVAVDQRHDHEREEADVDLGGAEPGPLLRDDQVAGERDAERAREDVPVRGDDRGLAELAERPEDLDESLGRGVAVHERRVGAECAQVRAGREHLLVRRSQDHAPHRAIVAGGPERAQQAFQQRWRERVARLGIVQGDGRDAAVDFVEDQVVGHRAHRTTKYDVILYAAEARPRASPRARDRTPKGASHWPPPP